MLKPEEHRGLDEGEEDIVRRRLGIDKLQLTSDTMGHPTSSAAMRVA